MGAVVRPVMRQGLMMAAALWCSAAQAGEPAFAYKFAPRPNLADPAKPTPAIDARYSAAYRACQNDPASTTYSLNMCQNAEMKRQDQAINLQWPQAMARVGKTRAPALRQAERKWIAAREAYCKGWADDYRGGTIAGVIYGGCYIDETIRRTIWLEHLR